MLFLALLTSALKPTKSTRSTTRKTKCYRPKGKTTEYFIGRRYL